VILTYIARRAAGSLLVLLAVSLIAFLALGATPGDAATALAGDSASAAQLAALRADLGLDRSPLARYGAFLQGLVARGDLGRSLVGGRPVTELVLQRLPHTVALALAAVTLAAVLGGVGGTLAALRAGTLLDTTVMAGAALGVAIPTFWSGLLLILFFSLHLRWLPVTGAQSPAHLILPAVTLALPTAAAVARLVRSGLLDVMGADYIRTARAKGLTSQRVVARHVLRNGLLPVTAVLGLQLGHLLGGAFIVETIFGWPGLGRLTVQAIFDRDEPVVLGAVLVAATMYLLVNLLVDLAHGWLDPRVGRESV
jgi:ABC-type dipeptide/oligopeptide/nickel transport system permease component